MTTQQHNQAKPIRSSVEAHSVMVGCNVRHKTNEAMDRCEDLIVKMDKLASAFGIEEQTK